MNCPSRAMTLRETFQFVKKSSQEGALIGGRLLLHCERAFSWRYVAGCSPRQDYSATKGYFWPRMCKTMLDKSFLRRERCYSKKHIERNNNSFVSGYPRVKIPLPFHHSFHVEFNMMILMESDDFYSVRNKLNIIRRYFYGFEYNQDCNDYFRTKIQLVQLIIIIIIYIFCLIWSISILFYSNWKFLVEQ